MPSDQSLSPGLRVEERARIVAAALGVADFVFSVPRVERGASGATREVGDGLLVVGDRGGILQVKSRAPEAVDGDDRDRAWRWISKHAAKAYRQGRGTRATIERQRTAGSPLVATPVRAQVVPPEERDRYGLVLGESAASWPTIVIIDHPLASGLKLEDRPQTFHITLEDWQELNRAVRSVAGILTYVDRVLRHSEYVPVPLGRESDRWSFFLDADERFADRGGKFASPWFSEDAINDPVGADLY